MAHDTSHLPVKLPIQARLLLLVTAFTACVMAYGCHLMIAKAKLGPESQRAADLELMGTATSDELTQRNTLIGELQAKRVVLKLLVDKPNMVAELHVLASFHALDVETKSSLLRVAYLTAFELPNRATKFSGLMYVMDGVTGEQLQTIDMNMRGTQFKG